MCVVRCVAYEQLRGERLFGAFQIIQGQQAPTTGYTANTRTSAQSQYQHNKKHAGGEEVMMKGSTCKSKNENAVISVEENTHITLGILGNYFLRHQQHTILRRDVGVCMRM